MTPGNAPAARTYRGERTRGRSERVRAAVMQATIAEIAEAGYGDLSFTRIAQGAGVALSTVHRRWGNKARLAADAVVELLQVDVEVPDLGALEAELRMVAVAVIEALRTPVVSQMLRAFLLLPTEDVERLRGEHARFGIELLAPTVARAVERGELAPGTTPDRLVERLLAGIWFRTFVTGLTLDEGSVDAFVRDALTATRAAERRAAQDDGPSRGEPG